jgi:transcriptional regulator with XRE-family HTH domain
MTVNPILKIIRAKKLGVLIQDARLKKGKSIEDCARAVGIPEDEMTAMETGERPPTLPELEILAYTLEIPLEHFWENTILSNDGSEKQVDLEEIKQVRQKVIGALIRKERIGALLSIEQLAEKAGIEVATMEAYENGDQAVSLPELEFIAQLLNSSIAAYEDQESQVGGWFVEQRSMQEFLMLPKKLQEFVGKPLNRPYLELAVKISELKAEKLRALAEGLLEITL